MELCCLYMVHVPGGESFLSRFFLDQYLVCVIGMKVTIILVLLALVAAVIASRELRSCNSCGMECENACGTRNFKTCCFNYMKKRSHLSEPLPLALDPSLRLELWLAKSRSPLYQKYYEEVKEVPKEQDQFL